MNRLRSGLSGAGIEGVGLLLAQSKPHKDLDWKAWHWLSWFITGNNAQIMQKKSLVWRITVYARAAAATSSTVTGCMCVCICVCVCVCACMHACVRGERIMTWAVASQALASSLQKCQKPCLWNCNQQAPSISKATQHKKHICTCPSFNWRNSSVLIESYESINNW